MKARRRAGLSEVMAAVITVVITVIAGAALYGFINGQAATSENGLGVANAANVNFLNERFVVANIGFGTTPSVIGFWVYNNGQVALRLQQVILYDEAIPHAIYYNFTSSTGDCVNNLGPCPGSSPCASAAIISPAVGGSMTPIPSNGKPVLFTITMPSGCQFTQGTTYYVVLTGLYGNVVVNYACYSDTGCIAD